MVEDALAKIEESQKGLQRSIDELKWFAARSDQLVNCAKPKEREGEDA